MPSPTTVKLVISSQVNLIDLVHAAAEKVAEVAGFDSDEALNVGLAMREAVINAMVHGNQQDPDKMVDVTLTAEGSMLTARVRDYGPGFDPEAKPDQSVHQSLTLAVKHRALQAVNVTSTILSGSC